MSRRANGQVADIGQSWKRMLRAKPVRNAAATGQRRSDDEVWVVVPRQKPRYLKPVSWLVRSKPTRTVVLDRLGLQIWERCDGQRTVEDIIDEFARMHRLSFHEARVAVTGYVKSLVERGAAAIVMPKEEQRNSAEGTHDVMAVDRR